MNTLLQKYYWNLFLSNRLFLLLGCSVVLFIVAFFLPWFADIPVLFFSALILALIADVALMYRSDSVFSRRIAPSKLSNNDENLVSIYVENFYPFSISIGVIDELPFQFQKRDLWFEAHLQAGRHTELQYNLRPQKRGEYEFGSLQVFARSPLGLISRRYTFAEPLTLPVYPSFLQMRKYELMAISNRLTEVGIKKIRRLGHSMEFEQIKNYTIGDDFRAINWKASARRADLMVNSYSDEKSQHVYCVIDKSRVMKMPFEGLSLLDYAINASLVLSNIAILKDDKAGLITVGEKIGAVVPADRKAVQIRKIMEVLYREKTRYLELNSEALYNVLRGTLRQRSLVVFFTNFESMPALQRQLPFLKRIGRAHLLMVVFFENTELRKMTAQPAKDVEEIYIKTIAEKFSYEKKQMVKELEKNGILCMLSAPQNLTVNTVNRYLEIKARQRV